MTTDTLLFSSPITTEMDAYNASQQSKIIAIDQGFSEYQSSQIKAATSEIAINAIRYADKAHIDIKSIHSGKGLEITVEDNGQGISDPSQAFKDGYSTFEESSLGLGLGAAFRMVDDLIINKTDNSGTSISLKKFLPICDDDIIAKVISFPAPNHSINCNSYVIKGYEGDKLLIGIIDASCQGMNQRQKKALSANLVTETIHSNIKLPLDDIIKRCHQTLQQPPEFRMVKISLLRITPSHIEYINIGIPPIYSFYGIESSLTQASNIRDISSNDLHVLKCHRPEAFCLLMHSAGIIHDEQTFHITHNTSTTLYHVAQKIFDQCATDHQDATIIVAQG